MKKNFLFISMIGGCFALALGLGWFGLHAAHQAKENLDALGRRRAILNADIRRAEDQIEACRREQAQFEAVFNDLRAHRSAAAVTPNISSHQKFAALLAANPKLFALWLNTYRAGLVQQFGLLYQELGLSTAQIDQFEDLMTAHQKSSKEFQAISAAQRINDLDPAIGAFYQQNDDQRDAAERALLGDEGYQKLQEFNRAQQAQLAVNDLASLVALTPTPLTYSQTNRLMPLLTAANQNGGSSQTGAGITPLGWQRVLAQAGSFLSEPQLTALKLEVQTAHVSQLISQFYRQQRGAESGR